MDLGEFNGTVLVFGGPYSNLPATEAVRAVAGAREIPPERVICTGDLVAYCASPAQTVSLIQAWGCPVVMGNCEESLASDAQDCGCGFDQDSTCSLLSVEWYRFAKREVLLEQTRWMASLPRQLSFTLQGKRFTVIHGSASRINEFIFASSDPAYKAQQLRLTQSDVLIGGHSGIPFGQQVDNGFWLNSGVIGMPANDGTREGWYLLLTPKADGVEASWHRLSYDWKAAVETMRKAEVSLPYAESLQSGVWPSVDILPRREAGETGRPISLQTLLL
ncbi:metallophosphoesterase family protein [uncultured Neptuniibacter sp.]|uniref:metallophosphoesterase family protein n=1 Tax=uncultured Neptuniibacter sp. TaxID=502143 RepID=UPI0026374D1F|nr:metallophosphoesterase family protein [uncultured Neptuniibacter sp.]